MKRWLHLLGPIVVLAVFAGAVAMLRHELRHYSYADLKHGLDAIPNSRIALAMGLTLVNYIVLMGYDLIAVRAVGCQLSVRRVALASFIGYAASYNFGALLGGTSARYRLYSSWGLTTLDIFKLLAMIGVTFWIGVFTLAGVVFLFVPLELPAELHLPFTSVKPIALIFLFGVAAYLTLCQVKKTPLRMFGWEFPLPSLSVSLQQILVASADIMVAASVLYVLLPPDLHVSYVWLVGVFLLAMVAVVTTHVPGGVGVFELIVIWMLGGDQTHQIVGALIVFRAVYYWLPLGIAAALLAMHELAGRSLLAGRASLRRWLGVSQQFLQSAVPSTMAAVVFLSGAVMLLGGSLPGDRAELATLAKLVPLPVLELSHFLGSTVGMVLMLLARGLQRRQRAAYWTTVVLLACGILLCLLKGWADASALVLAAALAVLLPSKEYFYRHGTLLAQPHNPRWSVAIGMVLVASLGLGLFAYKQVDYSNQLWWQFSLNGSAPRFLRATVGMLCVLLAVALARLFKPARQAPSLPGEPELQAAGALIQTSDRADANLALVGDKELLFDEQQQGFVMFAVEGRSWISLGDPVGTADAQRRLVWDFRDLCDTYDGWPVFYQVEAENLPLYLDLGLSFFKLGEQARVPVENFSLEGSARRSLRQTAHRFEKLQCTFEVIPVHQLPEWIPTLRAISDAWLSGKNTREKGFSLGYFDDAYLRRLPVAVVRREGEILAFANLLYGTKDELSLDLMRHLPDAPNGLMEFLFTQIMLWGREQGFVHFSLGMAPLAGLENRALAPTWNRVGICCSATANTSTTSKVYEPTRTSLIPSGGRCISLHQEVWLCHGC